MKFSEADRSPRVLYLVTSDISARFLRGQLAYLIERGHDVSIGTGSSNAPGRFDEGVAVHDVPFARDPSPLTDLRSLFATIQLIRRVRPTIVNASTPKAGLIGMVSAFLLRVPQRIYVVRGLRFETMTGVARQVMRLLERLATACATDVVYNSPSLLAVAERERAVRSGRGIVLGGGSGNGIDVDRFADLPTRDAARKELGLSADAHVIGFVGRLVRDKGIVDLVDGFLSAGEERNDNVLLLVGDFESGDPVPGATRRSIESATNIVHVPWVDDTRTVYPAMDVLAFPSYREGLPNVPLEAQLCGVPVIAYGATGTVDAVFPGPPNRIVDVGDRAGLSAAICDRLTSTPEAAVWVRRNFAQMRVWNELEQLIGRRR